MVDSSLNNQEEFQTISIKFKNESKEFNFNLATASLLDLSNSIYDTFRVSLTSQKLIFKGKLIDLNSNNLIQDSDFYLTYKRFNSSHKLNLILIGVQESDRLKLESEEQLRESKLNAFNKHKQSGSVKVRSTKIRSFGEDDESNYRFLRVEPFPESIECFELRKKMLDRLSNDQAILDIMQKRKYVVGLLKELHPLLQPTLLGLNKNAGEEISLRLLTDDLEGLRSYNTVRMVLLHELAHNVFGPHDNNFNELNSTHNKEVAEFERTRGIGSGSYEVWQPTSTTEEEELRKTTHTLNELEVGSKKSNLKFDEMDEMEMRRERVRIAAEKRRKEEEENINER